MHTILVCDDDSDIRGAIRIYCIAEGYRVLEAENGEEALEILSREEVSLVLMDVMMPRLDGVEATMRLRGQSNVPVIFLTAKGEDTDKILGLTAGGDDYVTKPFHPMELLARIKAQIRRYALLGGMVQRPELITVGDISMDDGRKLVTLRGEDVALTPTEYDILRLLMLHPGKVYSSAEIYRQVWKDAPLGAEGTVAVHIRHLREKLEIAPAHPRWLKVVWGRGYKLEEK